jgi:hypothetical protein
MRSRRGFPEKPWDVRYRNGKRVMTMTEAEAGDSGTEAAEAVSVVVVVV